MVAHIVLVPAKLKTMGGHVRPKEDNSLILDMFFGGLGVFFKTRRYVAYLAVFVLTTFLALFMSILMVNLRTSPYEELIVQFFVYVGATGTIYFGLGALFTGLGIDRLWITRRGRGRVTELKGLVWFAISFALGVFLSIAVGQGALLFFSMFCWVGWIAFQAFLSTRTSLRLATIAEPKKGGIAIGIGSFLVLIIGLGIIAADALAALVIIPNNLFGVGDLIGPIFPMYVTNIALHWPFLVAAMGLLGLFALVSLVTFFRYAGRGAALNIALLTVFIGIYSGYFLFNVLRRTGAPEIGPADIVISLFFLVYAMSGIGRTVTESVEESRVRLRDFGPLLTFFLASGFFYVDSIIAVSATSGTILSTWSFLDYTADVNYATFLFRDIAKLMAFPVAAILTSLYYLKVQRTERILSKAKEAGTTFQPGEVDKDLAEKAPAPGQPWPTERTEGIKPGKPGHEVSTPDSKRLVVDDSRRLGKVKRLGEEEEEKEDK